MSPTPEARARRKRWATLGISAVIFLLVVNGATASLLIVTRARTEAYAQCTAQWQQQFSVAYVARDSAYQARLDSAGRVSEATDLVIVSVTSDDPAKFREAIDNYLKVRADQNRIRKEQDEERVRNPLPPLPETLCGQVP